MKLFNSLTRKVEPFTPLSDEVGIYSCGPTVYNNLTIGNLSAFIYADLLRRVISFSYPANSVKHVMNITDVDDKTIRDSKDTGPDPMSSLVTFTRRFEDVFMRDMEQIGNDMNAFTFIRATESIEDMLSLIRELYSQKIAYITDDGVYFSIKEYTKAQKKYGQLIDLSAATLSHSRIANDEYEKESIHDFALWKCAKEGEPSWDFTLDGHELKGRPGWHIECSAMSRKLLGDTFDIHTGGIDLKFPHHENEIAQSTACSQSHIMARWFVHNEHMLVNGTKMSKSLGNFFTLRDVESHGYDPIAFRLLVLQSHYRHSIHFTWDNLGSAHNSLNDLRRIACLRWQPQDVTENKMVAYAELTNDILAQLQDDLASPRALASLHTLMTQVDKMGLSKETSIQFTEILVKIDALLGLQLIASTPNITAEIQALLTQRARARTEKDYAKSDALREELKILGIHINDGADGNQFWYWSNIQS